MKKNGLFLLSLFAALTALCNTDTPSTDPDNLISREYFKKQLSWVNPARLWICSDKSRPFEVRDEVLIMNSPKGSVSASIPLSIGYETADRFRLTFEYRLQGEGNVCLISRNSVKKRPGEWQQQNLKPTAEWKKIDKILPRIPESETLSISFGLPKKGAKLEVKNLKLTGLEPVKAGKIPVVLAGKEAKGIYCSKDDFHAWYSAKLFRSQLWRVMNLVLPLKACSAEELASLKNGIIFTSRAKNAGPGGYELMVTPGNAVIRGNDKLSGLELGAVDLLRRLGIEYYTTHIYSIPDKLQAEPCNICMTPAVPLRFTCWPMEMPELLGYSNPVFADNKRKIGAFYRTYAHTAGYYLPYAEFSKTHPEYYALQNGIIKGQDADVLAICEYWGVFSKTGRTALPMLEQYYPYIEKYNVDATYLGRAICSKYPIVSYTPHTFTGESRYYDDAVINYAGENIHVIVTHFHPSETPTKIAEAKQLFNYVSALTEKFIICGDFNSTLYDPFSETNAAIYNQFLNAGCTLANDGAFGIFPTACNSDDWATDKFAIDNIIASGGITITDVWTDLTKTTDGITDGKIDHIPLIAELSVS